MVFTVERTNDDNIITSSVACLSHAVDWRHNVSLHMSPKQRFQSRLQRSKYPCILVVCIYCLTNSLSTTRTLPKSDSRAQTHKSVHYSADTSLLLNGVLQPSSADSTSTSTCLSIAVTLCATTKGIASSLSFDNLAITHILLPSLLRTFEDGYQYEIFVGVDDDDEFYTNASNQEHLRAFSAPYPMHIHSFPSKESRIPFNEILDVAFRSGSDYIVRINDDTEFISENWTSKGIKTLLNHAPVNVGVVGPRVVEKPNIKNTILTHDMVHRTHKKIFSYYYSPGFDNQLIDDWITLVYSPDRVSWIQDWVVDHHISHHGTRYDIKHDMQLLDEEVKKGLEMVEHWQKRSVAEANGWVVLVSVSDGSDEDMFRNWWHWYSKLKLRLQVFVIAKDLHAYEKYRSKTGVTTYLVPHALTSRAADILFLLERHDRVLYADLDTVWLRDPTPFLIDDFDLAGGLIARRNNITYYSTGFLAVRNSSASRKVLSDWHHRYDVLTGRPRSDEHTMNEELLNQGEKLTHVSLPCAHFPTGEQYDKHKHPDQVFLVVDNVRQSSRSNEVNQGKQLKERGLWVDK